MSSEQEKTNEDIEFKKGRGNGGGKRKGKEVGRVGWREGTRKRRKGGGKRKRERRKGREREEHNELEV